VAAGVGLWAFVGLFYFRLRVGGVEDFQDALRCTAPVLQTPDASIGQVASDKDERRHLVVEVLHPQVCNRSSTAEHEEAALVVDVSEQDQRDVPHIGAHAERRQLIVEQKRTNVPHGNLSIAEDDAASREVDVGEQFQAHPIPRGDIRGVRLDPVHRIGSHCGANHCQL
jgi:hypothetical protein